MSTYDEIIEAKRQEIRRLHKVCQSYRNDINGLNEALNEAKEVLIIMQTRCKELLTAPPEAIKTGSEAWAIMYGKNELNNMIHKLNNLNNDNN